MIVFLRNIVLAAYICPLLISCGSGGGESDRKILATAGKKRLYADELEGLMPKGLLPQDSVLFVRRYVQNWAEEQLFLNEAESDKTINLDEINARVDEYRKSLIYHAHISQVVAQGMDTSVSDDELKQFYAQNGAAFELKDNILQAEFVVLPASVKKSEKAKKEFFGKETTGQAVESLCLDRAYRCQINDTTWISFDEFARIIPIDRTQSPEVFLRNRKSFEIKDTNLVYWVKIRDYKIKETLSPFEFVRDEIRLILLNRRKNEFLAKYRKDLFDRALQDKKIQLIEHE